MPKKYTTKAEFPDFNREFVACEYTLEGRKQLAEAINHIRRMKKKHWVPSVEIPLINIDRKFKMFPTLQAEKTEEWTMDAMVAILNREYQADEDSRISRDRIFKLENPHVNARSLDLRLIEKIAGLELLLNPNSGKAYDEQDFLAIAKEMLDWRTGEYLLLSCHNGVNGS